VAKYKPMHFKQGRQPACVLSKLLQVQSTITNMGFSLYISHWSTDTNALLSKSHTGRAQTMMARRPRAPVLCFIARWATAFRASSVTSRFTCIIIHRWTLDDSCVLQSLSY